MDGLDGDTRQTLGAAAAVGGPFDTALLAAVRARPAADIDAQLAAAAAEGLVRQVAAHDGLGWRFAHDRVEEAAFAALPSGRRAETHARIARCLAARWGEDLDAPRLFAVAHQYALGRDALDADDVAAPSLARRAGEQSPRVLDRARRAFDVRRGGRRGRAQRKTEQGPVKWSLFVCVCMVCCC
jgi:predicted ATPase